MKFFLLGRHPELTLAATTSRSSQWVFLACAVALVAVTIGVFYIWNTLRKPRVGGAKGSSEDVFAELCEEHGLNRLELALLRQIAGTYELPQPAAVFVDPWTLEQAAAAPGPDAHRYETLRQKLFGSLQ